MTEHEYEGLYPDDLGINALEPIKKDIHRYIEQILPTHRPDGRYSRDDKDWMKPVEKAAYEEAKRRDLTLDDMLRDWVHRSVLRHEREAAYEIDDLLRKIGAEGQLPLGWPTFLDGNDDSWKKALGIYLRSPMRLLNKQRVPFGAAALADFDEWDAARDEEYKRAGKGLEEGKKGVRFIKALFEEQQKARRADQLRQPGE